MCAGLVNHKAADEGAKMAVLRKLVAGVAALGLSTLMAGVAFASAGQWTGSQQHYNVYSTYHNVVSEQAFIDRKSVV